MERSVRKGSANLTYIPISEVIARLNDFAPPTLLAQAARLTFSTWKPCCSSSAGITVSQFWL